MPVTWEGWIAAAKIHGKSKLHERRVAKASRVLYEAAKSGQRLFLSVSGGKDSMAMAGLARRLGLQWPWLYAHHKLLLPDTESTVRRAAKELAADLYVVRPDRLRWHAIDACQRFGGDVSRLPEVVDEWGLLEAIPRQVDIKSPTVWSLLMRAIGSGNMLVAATYQAKYDGSIIGLRAEESRGRCRNAAVFGDRHRYLVDRKWAWWPIQRWTALDVYAYIIKHDLPLHPFYRAAWERFPGVEEDPGRLRVDIGFGGDSDRIRGNIASVAAVYPDYWRRLLAARPELRIYS